MGRYLETFDATSAARRWPIVRQWLLDEPLPFFAELRTERPVLAMPEVTLAASYRDCALILRRHEAFGVDLYAPKQGSYFMAQDDTPVHHREKAIMQAILDREQVPAIRAFVADHAATLLRAADGSIEAVEGLTRAVPIAVVQEFFGFDAFDTERLAEWSYWNQQDAFHNQPFDNRPDGAAVIAARKRAGWQMGLAIARQAAGRAVAVKLGGGGDDSLSRLLRLSFSGALDFNLKRVILNFGGLLIGAVETTSHATINALTGLLARPEVLVEARTAARSGDEAAFDGYVFEALRFHPAFPYFFRTSHVRTILSEATRHAETIEPGATVLAVTHSAMFDPAAFPDPDRFVPTRPPGETFTFGQGLHECLGRAIGAVMIPEIVRQCLLLPDFKAAAPVVFKGDVPATARFGWRTH
jgi:cytochrome P450